MDRQPPGLVVLFVTELWERFAYYGMRALLILYLIDTSAGGLGWSREQASQLYGWYNGLAYLTPLAGGWLADRFFGTNRSLVLGGALISAGHLTLALPSHWTFYAGLGLIIAGTGFFKPNVYTMVGQLYGERDPRRDSGFTLYYMGINLGALFGPLVCAWVAAHPRLGWPYGFGVAGVSMLIGLSFYLWTRGDRLRGVGLPPAGRAAAAAREGRGQRLSSTERRRVLALGIITVFVVFFWLAFEQVGSSLNIFAAQRTERRVEGWLAVLVPQGEIPAAWFQAINPMFVLVLAPFMAGLWQSLGARAPSTQAKMALGLVLLGCAYVVMVLGADASDQGARVSPWYLIGFYLIYSIGELCFLPAGFSFVGQAAPARLASLLMGLWFTANFIANVIGGYLAGMAERIERGELLQVVGGQADFFLIFVVLCLCSGALLFLLLPLINRLMYSPAQ
ncbi:MAG TPA: peptide MFS transporter [Gemmatimonadales bacterium]|nr:peptide MFS transporter [Gemmatimonadales bacterium]